MDSFGSSAGPGRSKTLSRPNAGQGCPMWMPYRRDQVGARQKRPRGHHTTTIPDPDILTTKSPADNATLDRSPQLTEPTELRDSYDQAMEQRKAPTDSMPMWRRPLGSDTDEHV